MLVTSGHVAQPPHQKTKEIVRRASVLCYRGPRDGEWAEPLDLSGGTVDLHEYRQTSAVSVPPYSPGSFAPVAWSDGRTVGPRPRLLMPR